MTTRRYCRAFHCQSPVPASRRFLAPTDPASPRFSKRCLACSRRLRDTLALQRPLNCRLCLVTCRNSTNSIRFTFSPALRLRSWACMGVSVRGASFHRASERLCGNVCEPPERRSLRANGSRSFPVARSSACSSHGRWLPSRIFSSWTSRRRAFMSRIHTERKLTILLVTHDLPLVRKHAQQVIWLHEGKVLCGTVAELLTPKRMAEIFELELS